MATNELVCFFEYKLYSLESISPCDIEPVPGNDSSPENFLKSELASQLAMTNAVFEARRCNNGEQSDENICELTSLVHLQSLENYSHCLLCTATLLASCVRLWTHGIRLLRCLSTFWDQALLFDTL